jgi:sarcosine oxidase
MRSFHTIVLGLGAIGSATVHHLARKRHRVLGIDQFAPPHTYGSTHGETRITRLAIGEGEHYTPLALRSHQLWRKLEQASGTKLLTSTGGLIISSSARASHTHKEGFFDNTLAAARKFGIEHEMLDADEIRRRFPSFKVADDERGYLEREAGFVRPEECVTAHLTLAARNGAEVHTNEKVLSFQSSANTVTVVTERDSYTAERLVLALGAWLPQLLDEKLARFFKVYRQTLFWFAIEGDAAAFLPERAPVFIWELQNRKQGIYGFPAVDGPYGGVKVASESFESTTTPEAVSRNVSEEEKATMYDEYVAPHIAGLARKCIKATACLYTVTPDFGFVIDRHPEHERVMIASPCSGHGFKHSAAIGEALSEIAISGQSSLDLRKFSLRRFLT